MGLAVVVVVVGGPVVVVEEVELVADEGAGVGELSAIAVVGDDGDVVDAPVPPARESVGDEVGVDRDVSVDPAAVVVASTARTGVSGVSATSPAAKLSTPQARPVERAATTTQASINLERFTGAIVPSPVF